MRIECQARKENPLDILSALNQREDVGIVPTNRERQNMTDDENVGDRLRAETEAIAEEIEELIDEIVDLEQCAREGRRPPRARGYRFKVNDTLLEWPKPTITGEEVLTLAGLVPPTNYRLRLKIAGGRPEPIGLDETVDLRRHGVEKFRAIRNGQSEGEAQGRRGAPTLEQDEVFLNSLGFRWEVIVDGSIWILIYDFPVPAGYTASHVILAIRIEGGYPFAPLDMMYVFPRVQRINGHPIPQADAVQQIDGMEFQRWSRHRTPDNPWVPGQDSLETHIYLMEECFRAELAR